MEYDEDGQEWVGVDDVAALVSKTGRKQTVWVMLTKAQRRRAEGASRVFDLPLPERRVKRPVARKPPWKPVAQWTPQWRRETIDAWWANRRDPVLRRQSQARPRDPETGRFLPQNAWEKAS